MTILDKYIGRRLLGVLIRTTLALVALFVFIDLLTHRRDQIMEHDVPWNIVASYYLYYAPSVLQEFQVAALSMFVAGLLVFGRMAQDTEYTAMLAGGVGLRRLLLVPVTLGLVWSAAIFALMETVGVTAATRADAIEMNYFEGTPTEKRPGVSWLNLEGGWTCHVMKFNQSAMSGEDVLLVAMDEDEEQQIQARRIYWNPEEESWILEDGIWSVFHPRDAMRVSTRRLTQASAPFSETPDDLFLDAAEPNAKSIPALARDIELARARRVPTARMEVDFHGKFASPALSGIMLLLGIPFALRLKRGGMALSMALAVGVGLLYLTVFAGAQSLGYMGRIEPALAAWLANGLFGAGALLLLARSET